ncbi:hypothetical protein [Streptomyces sp. cg2]|uniref:hypothetical protein n=1 Tax=Streptomyces sp. cg2 TaxID=3238799 RepID=UPI0034E239DD
MTGPVNQPCVQAFREARLEVAALASTLGQARRAIFCPQPPPDVDHGSPAMLLAITRTWPVVADALLVEDRQVTPRSQP